MSSHRRRTWILAALVALAIAGGSTWISADDPGKTQASGVPSREMGTRLTDVRVAPESGGAAVTLLASGPLEYQSSVLERPDRLVVDLQGVTNRLTAHQFPVDRAGVLRIRAGQYRMD